MNEETNYNINIFEGDNSGTESFFFGALEAILFAAGSVVPINKIALALNVTSDRITQTAEKLNNKYITGHSGLRIVRTNNDLQMCSSPEYYDIALFCSEQRKQARLSSAALEVLSIVAYFQPVTRAGIEQIRGVDSDYTVASLIAKGLIKEDGKMDVPGRPNLLVTTDEFLRVMDITELSQLPELPTMTENADLTALRQQISDISDKQLSIPEM